MTFSTIGIMSPGVMGSGVGQFLAKNGYRVVAALDGRSDFTRKRAADNGFEDVGDLDAVVAESDLVLSILDPAKAVPLAQETAAAMQRTNHRPVFADCNATSPQTAREMQGVIEGAGAVFVDVGIIGARPKEGAFPIFATSGAEADVLAELDGKAVQIMKIGPEVGQGSAVKICNGAFNKGAFALYAVVMLAAEHYGCTEFLRGPAGPGDEPAARLVGPLCGRDGAGGGDLRIHRPAGRVPRRFRHPVPHAQRHFAGHGAA
jgi:3-hydroxyisobutyrate dehydrogenase-like beta-hydroxyacid dehydrogenase